MSLHKVNTFAARLLALSALLSLAAGCDRQNPEPGRATSEAAGETDDPMTALRSQTPTTRYGAVYWADVAKSDTALWGRAKTFCYGDEGWRAPNCGAVRNVEATNKMAAPVQKRPDTHVRF